MYFNKHAFFPTCNKDQKQVNMLHLAYLKSIKGKMKL